ncbi:transcription factor bHLH47 [Syzygium oleosum]|uniref:transcription factor bHLH47 n=1 Tax=Syzygium oleosum TaxID=219896 RepID=UPI0024BA407A|nr:transcription factor bHLH47 [Syzygium oleosum]XP_056174912.1 transcription factor bHLH47 [Syzygium oleosum]
MVSEATTSSGDNTNGAVEASLSAGRSSPCKKNQGKVPKRIHKAEREKQKREHLNELFQDLASALELNQQNNGKASILCEAARLLKEIYGQIDGLKKDNVSLLSESRYVTVEKNELKEENSALEAQIEKLQSELRARVAESKPDLNAPPPECTQPAVTANYPGDATGLATAEPPLQQTHAVIIVPLQPDLSSYPVHAPHVSKPHPRYPTPADSWPSQLLGDQTAGRNELPLCGGNNGSSNRENVPDNGV